MFLLVQIKKNYHLLKGDCDVQWDSGGGEAAGGEASVAGITSKCSEVLQRRGSEEMEHPDSQRQVEAENRRSPSGGCCGVMLVLITVVWWVTGCYHLPSN